MTVLPSRIHNYLRASRTLARGGATPGSIALFPVRRRLRHPRNQITLRNGATLSSPPDEPLLGLFEEVWVDRCYDVGDLPDGAIVDIGGHVGVFAVWAASRYPRARILALEPSSPMCRALRENVAVNRLGNVTVIQAACAGRSGEAVLYSRGVHAMNSLYSRDNYGSTFRPIEHASLITLDEVFQRFAVDRCVLLKLDCEGAEYEILFGAAAETLGRIDRIVMEYHVGLNEHVPEGLEQFLAARGFEVWRSPLLDEEGGYLHATRRR